MRYEKSSQEGRGFTSKKQLSSSIKTPRFNSVIGEGTLLFFIKPRVLSEHLGLCRIHKQEGGGGKRTEDIG
jgi:hypothetical protein